MGVAAWGAADGKPPSALREMVIRRLLRAEPDRRIGNGPESPRAQGSAKAGQIAPRAWQGGGLLQCRNGSVESSKGRADVIFSRLRNHCVAVKNLGNC